MSLRNPFAAFVGTVLGKSDLQSMFCLLVFLIVSIVIAYLTNPSENSFRAYLTEQSFRHHLSRLDENIDDEHPIHNPRFSNVYSSNAARAPNPHPTQSNGPFHFANRASISLRTPKHVFHSFAIFTIAAMVPAAKASQSDDRDGWSISDSWYIGAFGKWWRGGVWETWYQDVVARSKDEESWNSGIITMKNLDMLPDFHGPSLGSKTFPYLPMKHSPPRIRNRDRLLPKSASSLRNGSPPPLSKTASLPLHAKRLPVPPSEKANESIPQISSFPPVQATANDSVTRLGPSAPLSRSSLFEHSPLIAEVLRQISTSSASVQESRTQLAELQLSASQSNEILQHELHSCRDRKRQEDASRLELKSRTKALDDSKRTTESVKREAERKLKAAQNTRDNTQRRIQFLDQETVTLHDRITDDQSFLVQKSLNVSQLDVELSNALEAKKQEIKATEDLLASLTRHSRELEDKLSSERARLQSLKQKSELRRQELLQQGTYFTADSPYALAFDGHSSIGNSFQSVDSTDVSLEQHTAQPFYGVQISPVHSHNPPIATVASRGSFGSGDEVTDSLNYASESYPYNVDLFSRESDNRFYSNLGRFGNPLSESPRSLHASGAVGQSKTRIHGPFHDYLPYDGPAAIQNGVSWHTTDELGYPDDYRIGRSSTSGQGKKGLNPDAKAFSLPRQMTSGIPYDALNPNGLGMSVSQSSTSTNSSLLRAFAPSPAEREALQRALGSSTNSSFERLPSLSDVGSIPSSPSHVHASPVAVGLPHQSSTKSLHMPSWFPTFLPRKSKFKPWDDEEPTSTKSSQIRP